MGNRTQQLKGKAQGRSRRGGVSASKSSRSSGSKPRSSSAGRARGNRTKEQLYNQAKRLKIPGRSSMSKQQLERAISRASS